MSTHSSSFERLMSHPDIARDYPGWAPEDVAADLARRMNEDDRRPEVQEDLGEFFRLAFPD